MRVALRVEVRSLRGLREGVANLMRLFSEYQVRASFFFPLGRDFSGRAPLQTWRQRRCLGLAAITYGTLAQAPSLRGEAVRLMAMARTNGHEVGVFGLSPLHWARRLAHADPAWTRRQCQALWEAYLASDGGTPVALAVPDWQVNPTLLAALSPERYHYSSITRGRLPYLPQLQGVRSPIPEIPTTLPTVAEMLRRPGVSPDNVHEYLYAESQHVLPAGHVFAASAEYEGLAGLGLMEKLLIMWKGQEGSVRALGDILREIDLTTLPRHRIGWGRVDGGEGYMAMQSVQVPV